MFFCFPAHRVNLYMAMDTNSSAWGELPTAGAGNTSSSLAGGSLTASAEGPEDGMKGLRPGYLQACDFSFSPPDPAPQPLMVKEYIQPEEHLQVILLPGGGCLYSPPLGIPGKGWLGQAAHVA